MPVASLPLVHPIPEPALARKLQTVHHDIVECTACDLCRGRDRAVPGEGPCPSEIVLLGEAPGAREDETGRPFIGASGKLLSQLLAEAGIDRARVFVTSVIKCRPENNRSPRQGEIAACRHHVDKQLERLAPRVVVLMGGSAIKARLGKRAKAGLASLRGHNHDPDPQLESAASWKYVCTYHPAAALRFPSRHKSPLLADLRRARRLADGA